jgi:hypothetical protein
LILALALAVGVLVAVRHSPGRNQFTVDADDGVVAAVASVSARHVHGHSDNGQPTAVLVDIAAERPLERGSVRVSV